MTARNIAIIAHVDHGKTTLVDQLFRQSGLFRDNQVVAERLMDSMDLERERGITIAAKNGGFEYRGVRVNIIDTPGHADFGGQVERVLKMADGALLLVDAQEGPMPQTYFVLEKALALHLPVIVVVNKIDKPAARPDHVINEVFDLFVRLNAPDDLLDFPICYASAKQGFALRELGDTSDNMAPLLDIILERIPPNPGDPEGPVQLLVSTIDYSPYLGRLGVGKVTSGKLRVNQDVVISQADGTLKRSRVSKLLRFEANEKVSTDSAVVGDIVAVAAGDDITVGVTITDPERPIPLPPIKIDPPTLSMRFIPNDSPFAGKEGKFVTSRQIEERLRRETLSDVALEYKELTDETGFQVSGRGELHLSILIERMRREGYEFQVSRPQVLFREENGVRMEPYEDMVVDCGEEHAGTVIEKLGRRRGRMTDMRQQDGMARLQFRIPMRGLLGYRGEFLTDTKGMGKYSHVFAEWGPDVGEMRQRQNGVLVAMETCTTAGYSLAKLQDRGELFLGPGIDIYAGQIIGEHCRGNDLVVNPGKGKKLTNMRASGSDDNIQLTTPRTLSLEDCIAYLNDDELLEITPKNIRMRKRP
ncbi:MAG: translational GTPase TypA [Myxococcales bacterium]|nr:translational GTPase TypA [Myxococcales bacterium]MCB9530912.1 translational GTPase TypA [Myxococcales bacterium]MCB9534565.1 translational GTPase TypA [Myxococcales bacterium]